MVISCRAQAAIISIASTVLKFSAITMDSSQESRVLSAWLAPTAALIQKPDSQSDTQVRSKEFRSFFLLLKNDDMAGVYASYQP